MSVIDRTNSSLNGELHQRLREFSETMILVPHAGDELISTEFQMYKVADYVTLVRLKRPCCIILGIDELPLAKSIGFDPLVVGLNLARMSDMPGQILCMEVNIAIAALPEISYAQIMADITDARRVENNRSALEKELNKANKQMDDWRRKDGSIKPLFDFDRSFALSDKDEDTE